MNSPVVDKPNQTEEKNRLHSDTVENKANNTVFNTSTTDVTLSAADQTSEHVTELSEDMEMIGPGQMLAEARELAGLSQEDVAKRLNFRMLLVENIENEVFDCKLPATFNRGYLRNYAKLVGIDVEDVLASYDALGAANIQRTEMQSFSNLAEKQAQHSRLMWVSYLIVAILIGSTIVWWLQDTHQQNQSSVLPVESKSATSPQTVKLSSNNAEGKLSGVKPSESKVENITALNNPMIPAATTPSAVQARGNTENGFIESTLVDNTQNTIAINSDIATKNTVVDSIDSQINQVTESNLPPQSTAVLSTAVFTFSGDCWVNIYDATGERIAWGVKKSGYVMTVSGKSPLKITLGKPELAAIVFDGDVVDMSSFNAGNIAKFSLPLTL